MVKPDRPPANAFVAQARKVYNPIGFAKGYNFILWFIFDGALLGFCLSRLGYFDYDGAFCAPDARRGDCFWWTRSFYREGMIMHLAGYLVGGMLAVLQFVPAIRHGFLLFHRINGYVTLSLALVGVTGAIMILPKVFGGGLDIRLSVGTLALAHVGALVMAYINIKRLQIEQHRAWMLRAWAYAAAIITLRIVQQPMMAILPLTGSWYAQHTCEQTDYLMRRAGYDQTQILDLYPSCRDFYSGANPDARMAAEAVVGRNPMGLESMMATIFGPLGFFCLILHAFGVELYLRLTPAEALRLREVSYQRQVEAGMRDPGRGGLTADRVGDAVPWAPK